MQARRLPTLTGRGVAKQKNYCNPPWTALPTLATKLRQSNATATVVAPYWPNMQWFQDLYRLASQTLHFPPDQTCPYPADLALARGSDNSAGASWSFG
jgi:hypothetical protein